MKELYYELDLLFWGDLFKNIFLFNDYVTVLCVLISEGEFNVPVLW